MFGSGVLGAAAGGRVVVFMTVACDAGQDTMVNGVHRVDVVVLLWERES